MKNGRLIGKIFGIGLMFLMLTSTLGGPVWARETDVVGAGYVDVSVEQAKELIDSDPDTADITVWVPATIDFQLSLKAGWNMIGSVITVVSIADPNDNPDGSVVPLAYWWDPESKSYVLTTDIEPGKGYWAASVNDCALTL